MNLETALQGGGIALQIQELAAVIVEFKELVSIETSTGEFSIFEPETKRRVTFPLMTAAESASLFVAAVGVFEARLAALNQQLSGL